MKYESKADLLIATGESIKMQEAAGIIPILKYRGDVARIEKMSFIVPLSAYELPLTEVEGSYFILLMEQTETQDCDG